MWQKQFTALTEPRRCFFIVFFFYWLLNVWSYVRYYAQSSYDSIAAFKPLACRYVRWVVNADLRACVCVCRLLGTSQRARALPAAVRTVRRATAGHQGSSHLRPRTLSRRQKPQEGKCCSKRCTDPVDFAFLTGSPLSVIAFNFTQALTCFRFKRDLRTCI